jgi:Ca2+-binding EF-hand superfamily protein
MDANSDGNVTNEEFMASPRGKKDPQKAAKKLGKMDADANGSLSLEEIKAAQKAKEAKEAKSGGSEE